VLEKEEKARVPSWVVLKGPVLRTGTGPGPDRFVTGF
jgi:hypothetical protein